MKEKHGEFMYIIWDDNYNDVEYVRGHVTLEEAKEACIKFHGEIDAPTIHGIKHRWARWTPASNWSDFSALLYTYDEKGKGMFAVTELDTKVRA